jgi:hypothetical protein
MGHLDEQQRPDVVGREIMRLLRISHGPAENMLDEALAGRERTFESITKLFGFVMKNFGQDGSDVTERFWKACEPFLEEAGINEKQMESIRRPFKVYGQPGFRSILEEFET